MPAVGNSLVWSQLKLQVLEILRPFMNVIVLQGSIGFNPLTTTLPSYSKGNKYCVRLLAKPMETDAGFFQLKTIITTIYDAF